MDKPKSKFRINQKCLLNIDGYYTNEPVIITGKHFFVGLKRWGYYVKGINKSIICWAYDESHFSKITERKEV